MGNKDIDKLLRQIKKVDGWRVEEGSKKWKVYPSDGGPPIAVSKTPSATNAIHKIHADLKRRGLNLGDRRS